MKSGRRGLLENKYFEAPEEETGSVGSIHMT